jgi:PAS domain S-box-containing protein
MLKSGATDYVLKQRLDRLVPSIQRALREANYLRTCKEAEVELYRRAQEFRALVENSPDIIARLDRNLRYVYICPAVEEATGIPPVSLVGNTALELGLSAETCVQWEKTLRQVFSSGERCDLEFELTSPNGVRYYQTQIVPEFTIDGSVQSLLTISRDVTQYKLAEAQLRQQKEELEQANRIKDEFLAVLSHELRSPLNPILGWAKLLRTRQPDQATLHRALETIERNAKLQTQLIEDLLDVSRIIQGKLTLRPVKTNLVTIIEAAIETVRLAASTKKIDLQFDLDPANRLFQVKGDPSRLQQVVWNLLSNAIKFTPQSGRVEIQLEGVEDSSSYAKITVSDTGIGINPNFIPYIFDSFRQADGSTTRQYGGLGLGLAIARQLVELHGGTISVTSPGQGQGATFIVKIPLIEESRELQQSSTSVSSVRDEKKDTYFPLKGVRVLVVDDSPDSLDLLVMILEAYGAIATAVDSAASAIEVLSSFKPDILVSDIGMPEEDGYSLIRRIRQLPPQNGGQIPAIALTAYASDKDRNEAMLAGFQKHFAKPVAPEEFAIGVAELVER